MRALYNRLFGPTTEELIDLAFKRAAEAEGELCKQNTLVQLYDELLKNIDHTTDWWSYAQAMQNKHDAQQKYDALVPVFAKATSHAGALIENYKGDAQ